MTIRRTLPLIVAVVLGCTPTAPLLSGTDAGRTTDTLGDQPMPADVATDSTSTDGSAVVDVAVVDAGSPDVPAAPDVPVVDVPVAMDVAPRVDVPPAVDVPDVPPVVDVPDAPPVVDGGTCPTGMVLIPANSFAMGDSDPASDDSQPPHMVTLSAYCIDLAEVTVAGYGTCPATGCTSPATGGFCNWAVAGRSNHPVNCVTWDQASACCQSRGGTLPTEAQWEFAARGSDGRIYPWGNDAPGAQLCWSGVGARASTCPIHSFPAGDSPFGLSDMSGNVWEWVADWYATYGFASSVNPTGPTSGTFRVFRGGNWSDSIATAERATLRNRLAQSYQASNVGFRCAHAPL